MWQLACSLLPRSLLPYFPAQWESKTLHKGQDSSYPIIQNFQSQLPNSQATSNIHFFFPPHHCVGFLFLVVHFRPPSFLLLLLPPSPLHALTYSHRTYSNRTYSQLSHAQLTHTQLTHTQHINIQFHTQLPHTQLTLTQLTHTHNLLTHNLLTHKLTYPHTQLHTQFTHTRQK